MTMNKDITQLNKLLKQKTTLHDERGNSDGILTKLLVSCIENNYVFNETQISGFLRQSFYRANRYTKNCYYTTDIKEPEIILRYMLTKNTITPTHIKELIEIMKNHSLASKCFDILLDNQYAFTVDQLYDMYKAGHKCETVLTNYKTLNLNVIYIMCIEIIKSKPSFNENTYINIIAKNNNVYDITLVEMLIKMFSIKNSGYNNYSRSYESDEDDDDESDDGYGRWKGKKVAPKKSIMKIDKDKVIALILDMLLVNCNDSDALLHMVTKYSVSQSILYYFIEKYGVNTAMVEQIFSNMTKLTSPIILKIINKGYKLNVDQINILLKNKIFSIYTDTYEYSKSPTHTKAKNQLVILTMDLFDICNCIPTNETLDIVCQCKYNYEQKQCIRACVNILLDKYKIIPTYETLKLCVKNGDHKTIQKILNYKFVPQNDLIEEYINDCTKGQTEVIPIVELLIKYGLVISEDSVRMLIDDKYYLDDLERFNIKYDEILYFSCYLNNSFPTSYMSKFDFDKKVLDLHKLCKTKCTLEKLQKHCITNNVKLDGYCLDFLVKYNSKVYRQLGHAYDDLQPNILTVYKSSNIVDIPIKKIAKQYNITTTDMFKQYDMVLNGKDKIADEDDIDSEE